MLYVDGMNGVINHSDTIQWLYSLTASRVSVIYFSYKEFHDPWKCLKILEFVLMKIYGFEHPWSWKALTVFTSTYLVTAINVATGIHLEILKSHRSL